MALALAVYLAAVVVWVGYDRRSAREAFPPGSVYATGDEGLSLAGSYLRRRGARVAALRRRTETEALPRSAVVFRVLPTVVPFLPRQEEETDKDQKDCKDCKDKGKKDGDKGANLALWRSPSPGEGGNAPEGHRRIAQGFNPGRRWGGAKLAPRGDGDEGSRTKLAPLLTAGEEAWVRAGGRLVLALASPYGPLRIEKIEGQAPVRKVFPVWPGVTEVHATSRLGLHGPVLTGFHTVALAGATPVIAREAVGAGEVLLLSCPEVLDNRHLGQAHHLALLEALAGLREGRAVFFDERAHGLGDDSGVTGTLGAWGLGPLLLLALLAAVAAFWRAAVRLGAADRDDRDARDMRSDAVELVDSLADLYDRALGRGDAVRLYHESFVQTVAAETGLRGPALEARARELLERAGGFEPVPATGPKNDLPRDRFDRALRTLNEAFRRLQDAKRT